MFIMGNFITALVKIIDMGLTLYMWIIVARALISWVNPDPYNPIVMFLYRATEPVMAPIRRWLPLRASVSTFHPSSSLRRLSFCRVSS